MDSSDEDSPTGRGGARVGYDAKGSVLGTANGGNSSEPQASESFISRAAKISQP